MIHTTMQPRFVFTIVAAILLFLTVSPTAASKGASIPADVQPSLKYLLELSKNDNGVDLDVGRIEPFLAFIMSAKQPDTIYSADDSFGAPSAYNDFTINTELDRLTGYVLDADIPSCTLWPSSLRMTRWTEVDGGFEQLDRLIAASSGMNASFAVSGKERVTITPDQHSGGYYSYDVDKTVIYSPYKNGKLLISVYRQQGPSEVGKKGMVLGEDHNWDYLYFNEKGLNLMGLGWVKSYMYDSFSVCTYYQPDQDTPFVKYGSVSWVNAGWSGINMVKPKHIHKGLVRVADAFKTVIEDPDLPDPIILAEAFSKSRDLPTPTLKRYVGEYFCGLEERIAASDTLRKTIHKDFNGRTMVEQMTRDELYATLALDYLKKILGRDAVLKSHPFDPNSTHSRQLGAM